MFVLIPKMFLGTEIKTAYQNCERLLQQINTMLLIVLMMKFALIYVLFILIYKFVYKHITIYKNSYKAGA